MSNNIEKQITKTDKKRRKKDAFHKLRELSILAKKASFIETHSYEIEKRLDDDVFNLNFLEYLVDDFIDSNSLDMTNENQPNYEKSVSIIFKICFNLDNVNIDEWSKERMRDKLRLYIQFFKNDKEINLDNTAKKYVKLKTTIN